MVQLPLMDVILYFQPSAKSSAPGKLYGVQEIAAVNGWHVQTIEGPISRELRYLLKFVNGDSFGPLRIVRRATTRLLSRYDRHVSNALELIRNEACSGLTADKVARRFPYSRRLADIRFRQATGHSILEEIHNVQLERAKQILLESDRQIKSISDFCGFQNPNSLRKFFKRETGMTLSEWKNKNRQSLNTTPFQ